MAISKSKPIMTEYELDKLCERNPNCDCKCVKCPLFAKYINSQNE